MRNGFFFKNIDKHPLFMDPVKVILQKDTEYYI